MITRRYLLNGKRKMLRFAPRNVPSGPSETDSSLPSRTCHRRPVLTLPCLFLRPPRELPSHLHAAKFGASTALQNSPSDSNVLHLCCPTQEPRALHMGPWRLRNYISNSVVLRRKEPQRHSRQDEPKCRLL